MRKTTSLTEMLIAIVLDVGMKRNATHEMVNKEDSMVRYEKRDRFI